VNHLNLLCVNVTCNSIPETVQDSRRQHECRSRVVVGPVDQCVQAVNRQQNALRL